jgi:glyoxylase-like metal-dependent hydrolase (beta-lactamase superfamily II)
MSASPTEEPRREPRVVQASNAGLFALGGTRSFVFGRRRVAVVDPGPDEPRHLDALAAEAEGAEEGVILLTHAHPDHAAGAGALSAMSGFPVRSAAPIGALRGARGHTHAGGPTGEPLGDGDEIATDEGILRVVATPGHSRDHLAFQLVGEGVVLVGDLLLGQGDTTWVGEYPGCVADYLKSLDRIAALGARRLLPAHGPAIEDPAEAIERFRAHRLARISQVEDELRAMQVERSGPRVKAPGGDAAERLVARLVDRVYGDVLPPGLRTGAEWSVRAILYHLGVLPFPERGAPTEGGDRLAPPS